LNDSSAGTAFAALRAGLFLDFAAVERRFGAAPLPLFDDALPFDLLLVLASIVFLSVARGCPPRIRACSPILRGTRRSTRGTGKVAQHAETHVC
jgi:hypothetical protein